MGSSAANAPRVDRMGAKGGRYESAGGVRFPLSFYGGSNVVWANGEIRLSHNDWKVGTRANRTRILVFGRINGPTRGSAPALRRKQKCTDKPSRSRFTIGGTWRCF